MAKKYTMTEIVGDQDRAATGRTSYDSFAVAASQEAAAKKAAQKELEQRIQRASSSNPSKIINSTYTDINMTAADGGGSAKPSVGVASQPTVNTQNISSLNPSKVTNSKYTDVYMTAMDGGGTVKPAANTAVSTQQVQQNTQNTQTAQTAQTAHPQTTQATQAQSYTPVQAAAPEYSQSQAVTDAYAYLKQIMEGGAPTFSSSYADTLSNMYDQIMNRQAFSYDLNTDALYQQYAKQYAELGKNAMKDTTGQIAGLTGGYGNTYAATAGQQAYNSYLGQLSSIAPELYTAAYNRYRDEVGDELNRYAATKELYDDDYQRYRESLSDYQSRLSGAYDVYNNERDVDYNRYLDSLSQYNYEQEQAYQKSQDMLAQQNWEREFAYQQAQDALAQQNYEAELAYQREQEAAQKVADGESGESTAAALAYLGQYEEALGYLSEIYDDSYSSFEKAAVGMGIPESAIYEFLGQSEEDDYEKLDTNAHPGGLFGKK